MAGASNSQGRYATWNTDKTETHELVIASEFGILSVKVVKSQGGRKVQVFTGYDTPEWEWAAGIGPHSLPLAVIGHKYIKAQRDAILRWNGPADTPLSLSGAPDEIIDKLPQALDQDIWVAINSDPRMRSHWDMVNGEIPGVSSVRGKSKDPVAPQPFVSQSAVEAQNRRNSDPGWGLF